MGALSLAVVPSYPRLATFFSVYPEPLGLSDAGTHTIFLGGELRGYGGLQEIVLHYDGEEPYARLLPLLATTTFVSLRFHRGQRRYSIIVENLDDTFRVVKRVAPALAGDETASAEAEPDDVYAAYTVVEMVTPVIRPVSEGVWVPAPPEDESMGPNLTRCIEALRQMVTAYRLTEHLSIPAPARERLGPSILTGTRPGNPAHGSWDGKRSAALNAFAIPGRHAMPSRPSAEVEKKISTFCIYSGLLTPSTT